MESYVKDPGGSASISPDFVTTKPQDTDAISAADASTSVNNSPPKSRLASSISPLNMNRRDSKRHKSSSNESTCTLVNKSTSPRRKQYAGPSLRNTANMPITSSASRQNSEEEQPTLPPVLLHPKMPPYEPLVETLLRHLEYARTIDREPKLHPQLTIQTIFSSLKRELQDALSELILDMTCHVCLHVCHHIYGRDARNTGHTTQNMRDAMELLETEIGSLEWWNWMDGLMLKEMASTFVRLRYWYNHYCRRESNCNSDGWVTNRPKTPTDADRMREGVRGDLPPFGLSRRTNSDGSRNMRWDKGRRW